MRDKRRVGVRADTRGRRHQRNGDEKRGGKKEREIKRIED